MERIEEFGHNGKQIIYFDLRGIKTNDELVKVVQKAKEKITCYTENSVYSITNIERIAFDSRTKEIAAEWMAWNKPYIISAAFIGATGVRKIMMNAVFLLSKRSNTKIFNDMEHALDWIDSLN